MAPFSGQISEGLNIFPIVSGLSFFTYDNDLADLLTEETSLASYFTSAEGSLFPPNSEFLSCNSFHFLNYYSIPISKTSLSCE